MSKSIIKTCSLLFFMNLSLQKVSPAENMKQIYQFGNYHSFDSLNTSILDIRYGVSFEFFYINKKFHLIETLFDVNCVLAFKESREPFVEIVPGFGLNALVRINLIPILNDLVFIEGGYGLIAFAKPHPDDGTYINGVRNLGIGYNIKNNYFLVCRWYHNSNADIAGRNKNPGLDTIGFSFGVSFQ